ncbi:MAG: hypothetical protein J5I65_01560 [Aridibacter famidurans]|nr:hypothetical protein [Aridibacter famidurans]
MKQSLKYAALVSFIALVSACGGSGSSGNGEMPEGINTQPVETGSNSTPGIPPDANVPPKGITPTPGIPANVNDATNIRKGTTPTPGIPDEETIRKQLERRDADVNSVNRPSRVVPNSNSNTRPADPLGRPRKTNSN